ncbi:hypothetical protein [Micromonospora sp. 4G55]|uniref:hypothetical protein n=1 Tax=Micromonospora sp. 4G55 TaxID=2806102 RepID=UPI001A5F0ABC|nr:hypothetical protein [Micromonospora sp. 4G55]MBM0256148.1 hypothetical protein [Micromonospora sp. 4G55]
MVGFLRTVDVEDLARAVEQQPPYDNHRNAVVDAESVGFRALRRESATDLNLFALFSLLVHGGGFPWFEDVYMFAGFMLTGDAPCRCYVRVTGAGAVYGLDIPLRDTAGARCPVTPACLRSWRRSFVRRTCSANRRSMTRTTTARRCTT